jgi:hypothetical protein
MKTCTRIRAGATCLRLTEYADSWCRKPDCPGHRAVERPAPRGESGWLSVPKLLRCPVPLDPDEAYDVRVTRTARAKFVERHGGTEPATEAELRSMLEDFLLDAQTGRRLDGYWLLIREGYRLVLSPDRLSIVGYTTKHAERSWSQVKAGVRSRFAAEAQQRRRARQAEALTVTRIPSRAEIGGDFDA